MGSNGSPISFLPPPDLPSVRSLDPRTPWRLQLAKGLWVENAPPQRLILLGEQVVASYGIGSTVEERLLLIRMIQLGWITASDLAARWGVHRNTIGNWQWRYRYFGLDGLVDGRLPGGQDTLSPVVRAAADVLRRKGRGMSVAALRRELEAQGLGVYPARAVDWLRGALLRPEALGLPLRPEDVPSADATPVGDAGQQGDGPPAPPPDHTARADGRDEPPAGAVPAAADPVVEGPEDGDEPSGTVSSAEPAPAAPTEVGAEPPCLPPLDEAAGTGIRHAGMALALPALQQIIEPVRPYLDRAWGDRPWRYSPAQLIAAFLFYLLCGFRNAEQVKAAPTRDFGPLIGRRRAPACITLRRRLRLMARDAALVAGLQWQLARQYLRLGWVEPGVWLVDGHFVPYHGMQAWAKSWYPQRRMPQRGHVQDWVHDRNGRPLWMHFTQAFDLFADQLPVVASALRALTGEPPVLVFDRGGYNAQTFSALNAQGAGWVTWLKGHKHLPAAAFNEQGELPGAAGRVVHYVCTTHSVVGCHDHVAAVFWHEGDVQQQVALLTNLDCSQPDRFRPLELIGMLDGRWAQENSFKAQEQHVDLGWTNGYAHESCTDTPVPNPRARELRRRLAHRAGQLRRAMDRGLPRQAPAQAKYRRRLGTLRAQITRTERELAAIPETVGYGSLGRQATRQLQPGRGMLGPVLRALAYHLRLQLRDRIRAVFPDRREEGKVLQVLLHTPGRYVSTAEADWVILDRPQLPRYAQALAAFVATANLARPHAPAHPDRPLRFALAPDQLLMHNAQKASAAQ